jgi:hypothetical protein
MPSHRHLDVLCSSHYLVLTSRSTQSSHRAVVIPHAPLARYILANARCLGVSGKPVQSLAPYYLMVPAYWAEYCLKPPHPHTVVGDMPPLSQSGRIPSPVTFFNLLPMCTDPVLPHSLCPQPSSLSSAPLRQSVPLSQLCSSFDDTLLVLLVTFPHSEFTFPPNSLQEGLFGRLIGEQLHCSMKSPLDAPSYNPLFLTSFHLVLGQPSPLRNTLCMPLGF